jgi:NAD(P)H dehydrogenase (quinone)
VRRIVGITTYGSKRIYMRAVGDAGRTTICRTVRILAPVRTCRTVWLGLYGMDRTTAQDRAAFLDRVEQRMAAL